MIVRTGSIRSPRLKHLAPSKHSGTTNIFIYFWLIQSTCGSKLIGILKNLQLFKMVLMTKRRKNHDMQHWVLNSVLDANLLVFFSFLGTDKNKLCFVSGSCFWNSNSFSDFDFSSNNQYIASSSMDKTVRVWEISKGLCIRVIYGVSSQLCIRFHPVSVYKH